MRESTEHVIADIQGATPGPLFVAVGGIHGNEPAGVAAASRVAAELGGLRFEVAGRVLLLSGNTRALARGVRYLGADLNRRWTTAALASAEDLDPPEASEDTELRELLGTLSGAMVGHEQDTYVVDMHTTSADGAPFATLGDTLRNREFALNFPVSIILGIEEQLDGTMLEHLSNLGCVTLGFEAGQHDADSSVDNHEAVLWIALVASGVLLPESVPRLEEFRARLEQAGGGLRFVEVRYRQRLDPGDEFEMLPGFVNFDRIRRGQVLARDRRGPLVAPETGLILMPLYQPLGDDGFFVARKVSNWWLWLSALLRRGGVPSLAPWLPGVRRVEGSPETLVVDTRLARFFPLQVFHLLGYRRLRRIGDQLFVSRRRFDSSVPANNE